VIRLSRCQRRLGPVELADGFSLTLANLRELPGASCDRESS
jgi:hypothetical protein